MTGASAPSLKFYTAMKKKSETVETPKNASEKATAISVSFSDAPVVVKGKIAKPKTCVGRIVKKGK